jgi:hypothetical protein
VLPPAWSATSRVQGDAPERPALGSRSVFRAFGWLIGQRFAKSPVV